MRLDVIQALALTSIVVGAVACGSGGGFPDARPSDAPPKPGTYSIQWTLTDTGGATITCTQAGAQSIVASVTNTVTGDVFAETFFCSVNAGTSGAVDPGTYSFNFLLEDGSGTVITTAPSQMNVAVLAGTNSALMPLTFVVSSAP